MNSKRSPRPGATAPSRMLAGNPVHERGQTLSLNQWGTVVFIPLVCETLGEEWPEWAWELCRHASAVTQSVPPELLSALLVADRDLAGAPCEQEAADLGVALDLCVTAPGIGPDARILITPFGHAVALLHQLHLDTQAAVIEQGGE